MCGFSGIFDLRGSHRVEPELAVAMAEALVHRGPDSQGAWHDETLALGFRRLSIIDLEGSEQPLTNEDGSVVLACNGEIFNYRDLRRELEEKGHRLSTQGDVEVLAHLYEDLGTAFLDRLDGQFACVLYDRTRRRLVLARDPFGICPLYWSVVDGRLLFASEIKALLRHPALRPRVDLGGLDQVLMFPGLVSPRTFFAGVRSLRPGHCLVVQNGEVQEREYWDLVYPRREESAELAAVSEEAARDELQELLERSVRRRLQADVEVGFYLSGGLDSSLIAALVSDATPGVRRHSFSIGFGAEQRSEVRYQELMAETVGSVHHPIEFGPTEVIERLETMAAHCECPVKETYNTCSLALSESARRAGVTVILTGEGADELFAGYVGYRFDQDGLGMGFDDELEAALEEEVRCSLWGDGEIAYENRYVAQREISQALYSEAVLEQLGDFDCLAQQLVKPERLAGRHPIHQRSYLDFKLRMADHLLSDHGDRMALAHSVEARFPFLSTQIVDFATRLPTGLKLCDGEEKYLVKRVAEARVPSSIVRRQKFGFNAPGSPELLRTGHPWLMDQLSPERIRRQGYFNPDTVERLLRRYSEPGFALEVPFETDLLTIVLTTGLLVDHFELPCLT
ncbi:MAG: asparagine synthase (glutamine-hydrolyzing) [Acidobacteriota bacterium]|nr:asparagine synthase (glutamine-hydrolyzing) [Acidobacteriota bacterium]